MTSVTRHLLLHHPRRKAALTNMRKKTTTITITMTTTTTTTTTSITTLVVLIAPSKDYDRWSNTEHLWLPQARDATTLLPRESVADAGPSPWCPSSSRGAGYYFYSSVLFACPTPTTHRRKVPRWFIFFYSSLLFACPTPTTHRRKVSRWFIFLVIFFSGLPIDSCD